MNGSMLGHHWRPGRTGQPFHLSMGLSSASTTLHAGFEHRTSVLAREHLTSGSLSRHSVVLMSSFNLSTMLCDRPPLSSESDRLTTDTVELNWSMTKRIKILCNYLEMTVVSWFDFFSNRSTKVLTFIYWGL